MAYLSEYGRSVTVPFTEYEDSLYTPRPMSKFRIKDKIKVVNNGLDKHWNGGGTPPSYIGQEGWVVGNPVEDMVQVCWLSPEGTSNNTFQEKSLVLVSTGGNHMLGVGDAAKRFFNKHEDTLMTVALVLLADHFFFGGKFRSRLEGVADAFLKRAEASIVPAQPEAK